MTLEEAKKILKKEGYDIEKVGRPCSPSIVFTEYESPEICEAMQVVCSAGYGISMVSSLFNERKARLSLDLAENAKAPGPGEEQPKDNDLKAATDAFVVQADEIIRLKKKNAELLEAIDKMKEGNPALKESASQFNDALLDEQADKIKRICKEITRLNNAIHKKNIKIEELRKESSRHLRGKIKIFGENMDLEKMLKDKNAVLSDVAEELRLSKIREKNLTEVCQKYMKENEELKKKLANKIVDKIDAQALKSAESALAWKEKVVTYKDMALAYYEKKIAEKDEVIADLGNELDATKKELDAFKESYKRRIKEDSEHFEHIQKICNAGLQKWLIESEYLEKDKPFRFPKLPDFSEEELMKLQEKACVDIAEEGKDHSSKVVLCGKDVVKKFKENEESVFDFFKSRAKEADEFMFIESGHLGGNGVFDQMEVVKPSQRFKSAVCDARLELLYFIS